MTEIVKKIPTMELKPGEPIPPGASLLEELPDRSRLVENPMKSFPVRDSDGTITSWERRPREDFV